MQNRRHQNHVAVKFSLPVYKHGATTVSPLPTESLPPNGPTIAALAARRAAVKPNVQRRRNRDSWGVQLINAQMSGLEAKWKSSFRSGALLGPVLSCSHYGRLGPRPVLVTAIRRTQCAALVLTSTNFLVSVRY